MRSNCLTTPKQCPISGTIHDIGDAHLTPMYEPCVEDYTVGWICALQEEYQAACRMLDDQYNGPGAIDTNDNNTYVLGRICEHHVVIACLSSGRRGASSAATVGKDMIRSFPSLRFALMVGTGGGAPTPEKDIRLGDVVVSIPQGKLGGVIQYDFGKRLSDGQFQQTGQINSPPEVLLRAIPEMRRRHNDPRKPDRILEHLKLMEDMPDYQRPAKDRLYRVDYEHEGGTTCEDCAADELEKRPLRVNKRAVTVHYGIIASANSVMNNAKERDRYARDPEFNVLCFETEAAGLMNNFPTLVIRGVCHYSDSHKNDEWNKYAALTAAAYSRELLHVLKPRKVTQRWAGTLGDLQRKIPAASGAADTIVRHQQTQDYDYIPNWLTSVNYGPQQSDYFERRQPATGEWLLDSVQFRTWRENRGQTLFCPGILGAGKTILTSLVVDHLQTWFRDDNSIGIAYIYCNFRRQDEQTAKELLASLLKQLVQCLPILPESVKSLYNKHKDKRSQPSLKEISSAIQTTAQLYSKTFILIDALDECRASDGSRTRFLAEVFELQAKSAISIFATSRPLPEITQSFNEASSITIRASQDDVRMFLESQVKELRPFIRENEQLQEKIKSRISEAFGGIFLLAKIYLESLDDKLTPNAVRDALEEIKEGDTSGRNMDQALVNMYDTAMERINRQKPGLRELAIQVLSWIASGKRQLTISELQQALATKKGKWFLDPGDLPQAADMITACAGLVTSDHQSGLVRFVHYTAQQYFDERRETLFLNAESDISMACATYSSFDVFESGLCRTTEEFEELLRLYPFYDYAAHHWADHARKALTPCQEVIDFLESSIKIKPSIQALMDVKALWGKHYNQEFSKQMTGLRLASYLGIRNAAQIVNGKNPMNLREIYGRNTFWHTAAAENEAIFKLLLNTGKVDTDARDTDYSQRPLPWAAEEDHESIVNLLLDIRNVVIDD